LILAKVVQVDAADDLALLKADGRFAPPPILPSKTIQLGSTVATIGFPDPGLQGFAQPFHLLKKNKIGEAM
jgi:S1-C subfamily serine protease